jgi:hypothetical protein
MRAVALLISCLALLSTAGCLEADVADGVLLCSDVPGRACPRNYYCAANDYCYKLGHKPGALPDFAMPPRDLAWPVRDFAVAPDDLSSTEPPPSD